MLRQIFAILLVATGLLFASLSLASSDKNGDRKDLYLSYEQRLALTYAMMAHGEQPEVQRDYLDRAEKYFTAVSSLPVKTVQVANFE